MRSTAFDPGLSKAFDLVGHSHINNISQLMFESYLIDPANIAMHFQSLAALHKVYLGSRLLLNVAPYSFTILRTLRTKAQVICAHLVFFDIL